jgi:tetratricopeptide (TPR) repeat protein
MGNHTKRLTSDAKLAMRRAAEGLAGEGKHAEACQILEELAAASPKNPLIWNDLGVRYEAAGEMDKAIAALRRGHAVDPTYPPTLYNLGKFTLDRVVSLQDAGLPREGLLAEAIGFLNANLDRDPENEDAHFCLAQAYSLKQDEAMAGAHRTVAMRLRAASIAPSRLGAEDTRALR